MSNSCIFCSIKNNKKDFAIVRENDSSLVVVDALPMTEGHLLVIPKQHYKDITEVNEESVWNGLGELLAFSIIQLRKLPNVVDVHLNINTGKEAHQTVFHTHIHLVPCYNNGKGFKTKFQSSLNKGYKSFAIDKWKDKDSILNSWNKLFTAFKNHLIFLKNNSGKELQQASKNFHICRIGKKDNSAFHFIPNSYLNPEPNYKWMENARNHISLNERKKIRDKILKEKETEKPKPYIPPPKPKDTPPNKPRDEKLELTNFIQDTIIYLKNELVKNNLTNNDLPTNLRNWESLVNGSVSKKMVSSFKEQIIAEISVIKNKDKKVEAEQKKNNLSLIAWGLGIFFSLILIYLVYIKKKQEVV